MAYELITPSQSFVRFDGEAAITHCIHGEFKECLPLVEDADVAFQFVIQAETIEEADDLCGVYGSGIQIGLVADCEQEGFDVEFSESPQRFRISPLQVLYNWNHGLSGAVGFYEIADCFKIRVVIGDEQYCSNCFQRMAGDCFTSVLEYGNEDNFAGFNYCNSGEIEDEGTTCEPTIVQFVNKATLTIPYTASLQNKYGTVPTIQVWIDDGSGGLRNDMIQAVFDTMPPTTISFDFGGPQTGIVVIR